MAIVDKPTDFFTPHIWNGTSSNHTESIGMQPDLVWVKGRSVATDHTLFDVLRGPFGIGNSLSSNTSAVEGGSNTAAYGGISGVTSDGFTVTAGSSSADYVNTSGRTYASWNWKANGSGSSNTTGSINSTVSANTTAGFSIVKYTGNATVSTIGHGLGVAPNMIITKNISRTDAWPVDCRQGNNGAGGIMYLNETGTLGSYGNSSPYPSTAPTSSVYSVGTAGNTNFNGSTLIAYCFAEKIGFSKFGQFNGNSSDDGTMIYTGFAPAVIIVKRSDTGSGNWVMQDNKRSSSGGFNENSYSIKSNTNAAEVTNESEVDLLSNGWKFRNALTDNNAAGSKYIYMAFAENPFVTSSGVPGLAR